VRPRAERGMSLIELMIAMLVLAIGLGGITILLTTAIASNNRNSRDTTSTLLAQMVIEQISAQHVYTNTTMSVTDCAGTIFTIATAPGAVGTGAGANLLPSGTIDFTQAYAGIPANYAMQYVDCSAAGGIPTTYEVRWNVMSVSTNASSRLITAAARPLSAATSRLGGLYYAPPVNLRSIGAPSAGL
jgi:prepilin-type N-terminal cleavage/methylation domain-containing protein